MTSVRPATREDVAVLDLTPLTEGRDITELAKQLDRACRTIGFFYVENHGIPEEVLRNVFAATKRYFDIPLAERMAHKMDDRFRRGFMPQGINQHPGYAPDLKERYEVGVDLPLDHPLVVAGLPLHGPNKWPADMPWLREAAETYFKEAWALGERLLKVFAVALGVEEGYFLQYCKTPMVQARLFHYPPQMVPPDEDVGFGVAPHTDYGMITLLSQDPIGGLELRTLGGEWVSAPYIDGTLIINLGDMLRRWTNDNYVSNPHRVVNRSGKERYSIPMFFNLDFDAPVECLPTCQSPDNPPKHEPILSGEYLQSRFRDVQKLGQKI